MAETADCITSICIFHQTGSAQAALSDLIALGLPRADIAVVGDEPTELNGSTRAATLQAVRVPDADIAMLLDGLGDGGTVVAVRASPALSRGVDAIFKQHSAVEVDDKIIETNAPAPLRPVPFANSSLPNPELAGPSRLDLEEDAAADLA